MLIDFSSCALLEPTSPPLSIQGNLGGWMNPTDPLDDTKVFNETGLVSVSLTFDIPFNPRVNGKRCCD